jgi:2-hydroxy-3-keto-5-methylthiopentenyl-1-phosphate phosphatase
MNAFTSKKDNNSKGTLVLCDFDGTASAVDVGYLLLRHFTKDQWEYIDQKYRSDRMGSLEAYELIASFIHASEQEFEAYLPKLIHLDPGFMDFTAYCRERGFDLKIVSDGLDFYIKRILASYGINDIPYFSNRMVFNNGHGVRIEFPLMNPECGRCGTCKKTILERYRDDYETILYIGDGYSDRCAAQEADFVFGKKFLYKHCEENGVPCVLYDNFTDIQKHLEENRNFKKE